jgi:hypothetical protein
LKDELKEDSTAADTLVSSEADAFVLMIDNTAVIATNKIFMIFGFILFIIFCRLVSLTM